LIDNIKDAYSVPYLYQSLCKSLIISSAYFRGGEDESKKVKNAARNFSTISKMALSILKNDKTTKGSLNLKRLKAGWDEEYLSKLLEGSAI